MVSILRTVVFCWISCWNIALNSLRNVGRDMGSSTLGEARVGSVPCRACTKNLRKIYFSYVHSIVAYGIIFCGNSTYSNNIFKLQKRAIRIIMNASNRVLWCEMFKKLNILPLHSQYILSLLLFVVKNTEKFTSNSEVHSPLVSLICTIYKAH